MSCSSRTTIWPPEPAPITSTSCLGTRAPREGRSTISRTARRAPAISSIVSTKSITSTERGSVCGEGLDDGEDDDQERAGDGDGAEDQQEVAAADVAPPLLVEPEGGEDDQLADDDEADRLREQHLVAMRPAVRFVEEAQLEGEEEGERDENRVGRHLQHPVAVDGVVQPAHRTGEFRA